MFYLVIEKLYQKRLFRKFWVRHTQSHTFRNRVVSHICRISYDSGYSFDRGNVKLINAKAFPDSISVSKQQQRSLESMRAKSSFIKTYIHFFSLFFSRILKLWQYFKLLFWLFWEICFKNSALSAWLLKKNGEEI